MEYYEKKMPDYLTKRGNGALERNIHEAGKQNRVEKMQQYLENNELREHRTE